MDQYTDLFGLIVTLFSGFLIPKRIKLFRAHDNRALAKLVALHSSLKIFIYDNLSLKEAFDNNKRVYTSIHKLWNIGNETSRKKPCYEVGGAK